MFGISTKAAGQCDTTPDTCNTPSPTGPVPIVYPNMAMLTQANPGTLSTKVKIENQSACTKSTVITMTSGDEAGTAGGLVSGMFKGPAQFKKGSATVTIEGQPAVFQTCTVGQNGTNANAPVGVQTVTSQSKVTVTG
jgi:hypothetical protein